MPTVHVDAAAATPTSDGVKLLGGAGGLVAVLALVDKIVQGTGLTADELVKQLGPGMGVLYMASPIVLVVLVVGMLILRGYKAEQAAHRRRDRRLQQAIVNVSHEIGGLREDVAGFTTELSRVKEHVEARIDAAVGAAARAATHRADQADHAISDLRAGQEQLNIRVGRVEEKTATPTPPAPRRDAVPTTRRKRQS